MSTFGLVGRAAGVFVACAAANWFFGGTSDDSRDDPKPPRYSPPTHSPPPSYGSFPGSTADDKTRDASQVAALQAQVQAGNNLIRALETKLGTLSIAMKRAEADAEQVKRLRAEARVNDHLIASLESKLDVLRDQARTKDFIISDAEARTSQLSAALEKANADAARLGALWADASGSDAIIFSLDSKLEVLRAQGRNKDETIATLEENITSLSAALETVRNGRCDRCNPPPHIATEKARGRWLRRQADALNEEAGRILFDAHNPELVGARARLRDDIRIDLHQQYRLAAVEYVKKYAASARDQGLNRIIFIVGKGLHSEDNIPKLRPLVLETLRNLGMEARSPPNNPGEILVKL